MDMDQRMSLKELQRTAVRRMLAFDADAVASGSSEGVWKVLIYDDFCRDVLAPLLKVVALRKEGVTLHLHINAQRDAIPDTAALYFVLPTASNVRRIAQDAAAGLYASLHLSFAAALPRSLLEDLAALTLQGNAVGRVSRIVDEYCNFLSLEPDMFSLNLHHTYCSLHGPGVVEAGIMTTLDGIVDGLFSVLVTIGQVPIIRCPRGSAAAEVARRLDERLRTTLQERNNVFQDALASSFERAVLVIEDRNADLPIMMHHTLTYQALVHDVLGLKLNKVTVPPEMDEEGNTKAGAAAKAFEVDDDDEFWRDYAAAPFPEAAEASDAAVKSIKKEMDDVSSLSGGMSFDQLEQQATPHLGTKALASAISSIPELVAKKKMIDKHTNILYGLLAQIKQRQLDKYYEMEEALLQGKLPTVTDLMPLMEDEAFGSKHDKLRLFLMYYLTTDVSDEDLSSFTAALERHGTDTRPIAFLKRVVKSFRVPKARPSGGSAWTEMMSGIVSGVQTRVTTGVKNLVVASSEDCTLTKTVDALMELKETPTTDQYLYFDPKSVNASSTARSRTPFRQAVVFVVGGGNYVEYQNLQTYAMRAAATSGKMILYGATDIVAPAEFVDQLAEHTPASAVASTAAPGAAPPS